ncbi:MAG: hypothetical protein ACYDCQ_01660 [Dehalococcoidia bacterium]
MLDTQTSARPETGTIDIAFVVLLMQGSIGIFTALTQLIVTAYSHSIAGAGPSLLFAFGWPALAVLLGAALVRLHRSARTILFVYECLSVLSWLAALVTSRGAGLALMPLASGALIPLTVILLLRNRSTRTALARRRPGKIGRVTIAEQPLGQVA